jgi:hypothetical protein
MTRAAHGFCERHSHLQDKQTIHTKGANIGRSKDRFRAYKEH